MRRLPTTGLWALLLAFALGSGPAAPAERVEFRLAYRVGATTTHRVVTETVGTMKFPDPIPEQKFTQRFEQDLVQKCVRVAPDGGAVVEVRMARVAMRMTVGSLRVDFDSAAFDPASPSGDPRSDALGKLLVPLTELTWTITLDAAGQPTRIEGLAQAFDKVIESIGTDGPLFARRTIEQLRSFFNDEAMAEQMRSCYRIAPGTGVRSPGDTWERAWEMKIPMFNLAVTGRGEYRFVGMEDIRGRRLARIRMSETARVTPGQKPPGPAGLPNAPSLFDQMEMTLEMGEGEGYALWDPASGELVQQRQTQRMTMRIGIRPDPRASDESLRRGLSGMEARLRTAVRVDLLGPDGQPVVPPLDTATRPR